MKKLLCLILAVLCVISLTACGQTEKPADSADGTKPATQPTTTQPTTAPTVPTTAPTVPTTAPTVPTTAPTVPTTVPPTEPPEVSGFDPKGNKTWAEDGVLKILTIGNSFSRDAMAYVYDIAYAAGAKDVYLGDMYIGSCTIEKHLTNAMEDNGAYSYFTNEMGKWVEHTKHKMSDAIKSQNWDFISIQQNSKNSGLPETYAGLQELVNIIKSQATNPKVEIVWHMTWACAESYTGSLFANYQMNQEVMYNAIVDTVKKRVFPIEDITRVIPNGTVMQNIRSSYFGDNICRDGLHMSLPHGRILAGITIVASTIGIDWDTIDLTDVHSKLADDDKFIQVALESVKNAMENPYAVTQSKITK